MFYFKLWIDKSDHKFEMFYDFKTDNIILRSIEIPAIFMASSDHESVSKLFNFVMNFIELEPKHHTVQKIIMSLA